MDNLNTRSEDVFSHRQGSTSRKSASRKYGRPSIGPGDLTPPSSGSQHEREAPHMLMSPPPEEELRTTRARSIDSRLSSSPSKPRTPGRTPRQQTSQLSKRKRVQSRVLVPSTNVAEQVPVASTSQVTIEATPNPKARKQAKHATYRTDGPTTPTKSSGARDLASPTKRALLQSPHSKNPNADYLPALHEFSRETLSKHRTHTPVRPYEPPADRFTPPREVVYTPMPSVSKSSKRKSLPGSRTKGKERRLTIQIKKEPPEIDLSEPLPPGSPTDDPLLLHGRPANSTRRSRPPRASLIPTHARDTPPISSSSPIRVPTDDATQLMDMTMGGVLDDSNSGLYDEDAPLPAVFDFENELPDSPDRAEREQTPIAQDVAEEYTTLSIPTKLDPPSSCTKERMDRWGRPVSPFPYQTSHSPTPVSPTRKPDTEESPARLHPAVLAAADRAQAALQPGTLSYDMDESEPPPSTSPVSLSSPSPSKVTRHNVALSPPDDALPPSDPPSPVSSPAQLDVGSSEGYYLGHDTIAEYEVPLAGDDSSSEPGDSYPDNILGSLERQPLPTSHDQPKNSQLTAFAGSQAAVTRRINHGQSVAARVRQYEQVQAAPSQHVTRQEAPHAHADTLPDWSIAIDERDGDEDEIEDAESVVRELSHEPDFRDDEAFQRLLPPTPQGQEKRITFSSRNPSGSRPVVSTVSYEGPQLSEGARTKALQRDPSPEPALEAETTELEMDDGAGLEDFDLGVIKISSEDPMAAARAAAILRLHRYDCLEKPPVPKRPQSLSETTLRNSRRKSVRESGINKSTLSTAHRRRSLGGMIGDKVVRPGAPAVTLPDLLREAEESLIMDDEGPSIILPPAPDPPPGYLDSILNTPRRTDVAAAAKPVLPVELNTTGPRDWTKSDWKTLDGCYTDERLSLGEKMGLTEGTLAAADQVDPESVAARFVELMGGENVIGGLGTAFNRDNLLKRVRALKRKQSSGDVAPPCHSPSGKSAASYADMSHNFSMLMSPNASFFGNLLSMSRLTPRRAATSTSVAKQTATSSGRENDVPFASLDPTSTASSILDNPPNALDSNRLPPEPSSLAGKVKGLIYSYLPKAPKASITSRAPQPPKGPALPPPPPELFHKPRAAITTPVPKPIKKPPNPRELVQLNPVPKDTSGRAKVQSTARDGLPPRAMEPSSAKSVPTRDRRDSNVSVKDLIKSFESLEREQATEHDASQAIEIKRRKSNHDLKGKPVWKP